MSFASAVGKEAFALYEVVLGIALVGYGYQRACIEGLPVEDRGIDTISVLRYRYGSSGNLKVSLFI